MQNIFLTGNDHVIDLSHVIAIEIIDEPVKYSLVRYHLSTGATISARHQNRDSAITEKWQAFNQMRPGGERYPICNESSTSRTPA